MTRTEQAALLSFALKLAHVWIDVDAAPSPFTAGPAKDDLHLQLETWEHDVQQAAAEGFPGRFGAEIRLALELAETWAPDAET